MDTSQIPRYHRYQILCIYAVVFPREQCITKGLYSSFFSNHEVLMIRRNKIICLKSALSYRHQVFKMLTEFSTCTDCLVWNETNFCMWICCSLHRAAPPQHNNSVCRVANAICSSLGCQPLMLMTIISDISCLIVSFYILVCLFGSRNHRMIHVI